MGLFEPLPMRKRPSESVSMDFIMALPKLEGFESIMVLVDLFRKYLTFIAATTDSTTEEVARLFLYNVVMLWGVPKSIVNNRDPRFAVHFWPKLFKLLVSDFNFSMSFHPQSDRKIDRMNVFFFFLTLLYALCKCQAEGLGKVT